jgi:hypothetical protein
MLLVNIIVYKYVCVMLFLGKGFGEEKHVIIWIVIKYYNIAVAWLFDNFLNKEEEGVIVN